MSVDDCHYCVFITTDMMGVDMPRARSDHGMQPTDRPVDDPVSVCTLSPSRWAPCHHSSSTLTRFVLSASGHPGRHQRRPPTCRCAVRAAVRHYGRRRRRRPRRIYIYDTTTVVASTDRRAITAAALKLRFHNGSTRGTSCNIYASVTACVDDRSPPVTLCPQRIF